MKPPRESVPLFLRVPLQRPTCWRRDGVQRTQTLARSSRIGYADSRMAHVLVVDDDLDMADACAEILRLEGHDVRVARNGREGLVRMSERLPDLVVCDVEMPVLDGPGMACRMLLEDGGKERIPFLLSSGVADLHRVAKKIGTPYLLPKPFSADELLSVVARALAEQVAPAPRSQ